jgi:PAP2 superfamily
VSQWAGFAFLYFYLNAKLKVFSNHHPAMWKLIALYAPLLGATLIAGALTIDEFHNWYDVVAGAIIGSVMAISAYRMVYASVWDFRFNHIPLTRHTPFAYGGGSPGAGGFESAVWTHKAGWGYEEALGGAPFDAAHGLRGTFGNASGLTSGENGMGHHNHNHDYHGMQGGFLGTNGNHPHNNHETTINDPQHNSHGGGFFSRIRNNQATNHPAASEPTTFPPHMTADIHQDSNDLRRESGIMHPGYNNAASPNQYDPSGLSNHRRPDSSANSIGRRPVPPAKEASPGSDRMV